jgi:hypothetical protein
MAIAKPLVLSLIDSPSWISTVTIDSKPDDLPAGSVPARQQTVQTIPLVDG